MQKRQACVVARVNIIRIISYKLACDYDNTLLLIWLRPFRKLTVNIKSI